MSNRTFEIELTNRGKSDIISWSINLINNIYEGEYLNNKFGIIGDYETFKISSKSDQSIAPNQTIKVPIILVGDFPKIEFSWEITYTDLMEGEYNTTNKNNGLSNSNLIAFNFKE